MEETLEGLGYGRRRANATVFEIVEISMLGRLGERQERDYEKIVRRLV